ncbi:MAG: S9 family peptidase [Pseudomonadales bacterium]|nr:S9 family peptidase [Pseudomonadales bacterium]
MHRWLLPALVFVSPLLASSHADMLPPSAYGRLPALFDVALSPDGQHLAIGRNTAEGEQFLQVVAVASGETVAGITHRPTAREDDKAVMRKVGFADERRATYLLSATLPASRGVPYWVLTPGRRHVDLWRTALLDLEDRRTYLVKRKDTYDWGLVFDGLWSPLPGRPDVGRMVIRSSPYREGTLNVYDVNLSRGSTRTYLQGSADTKHYIFDSRGEPVFRLDVADIRNRWSVLDLRDGKPREVLSGTTPTGTIGLVNMTADGRPVFLDVPDGEKRTLLYAVHPESGQREVLFSHPEKDVSGSIGDNWTGALVGALIVDDLAEQHFFDPDLAAVQASLRRMAPNAVLLLSSWDSRRELFVIYLENPGDAGGYYLWRRGDAKLQLLALNYPELTPDRLGARQAIRYPARDGTAVPAYVTFPPGATETGDLPLVVLVHGGPTARDDLSFDWWAAFLASRGYVVVQPNFRGSDGYGLDWQKAGYRQWGKLMQSDVEDAVVALGKAGLADASRTCIVGGSYGGYAALMGGVVTPERYRCVASIAGVSDLPAMLSVDEMKWGRYSAGMDWFNMIIGDRREDREALEAASPAFHAEKAKAPFLLIHGKLDTVVPVTQSWRMRDALEKAKKDVRYVEFSGEDHWLSDGQTRIGMLGELDRFLGEHLRSPEVSGGPGEVH